MRQTLATLAALALLVTGGGGAMASDLVYTPINPSFGGNPANSSHLLSIASAQKTATADDAPVSSSSGSGTGSGGSTSQSNVDLFVAQLQGRLLSALAAQVTDAIFGQNPQQNGTIQFGDTTISFVRDPTEITLNIVDNLTGQVTTITVPQLVSTP